MEAVTVYVLLFCDEVTQAYGGSYVSDVNKAIPLHASTGPEGSRRLRLPHFITIDT